MEFCGQDDVSGHQFLQAYDIVPQAMKELLFKNRHNFLQPKEKIMLDLLEKMSWEKRIQMVIDEAFKRDTPARDAFYQAVDKEMTKQKGFSR